MEKFFWKAVGHCTEIEMFSPPRKDPKPSMYVSFGLNWKVSLTKEYDWLLPEFLGNKLMVARTTLSTRTIIPINNRTLVLGGFISGHPLNESNQWIFNSAIN